MQRKAAIKCKAIERATACNPSGSQIVFTLIKKSAGFLTAQRFDSESNAMLIDFNLIRRRAVERAAAKFEPFNFPHTRVVTLDNRPRLKLCNQ